MICASVEANLFNLFFVIRDIPGWLADCWAAGFSKDELDRLEEMSDEYDAYDPFGELKAMDREIEREGGHDVYFSETDDDKIRTLSQKIADIYRDYERHMWNDGPYQERFIMLKMRNVEGLERLRRGIRGRQLHNDESVRSSLSSDRITDQDIERAREYPLERLIPDFDMARAGYVRCQWHEDKRPSMLVKNGFGFCFSCQKSVDSIGWLVEVDKMSFVDAVKYLRGKC